MQLLVRVASALSASVLVVAAIVSPAHAATRRVPAPDYSVNAATHPNEYANRIVAAVNDAQARAGLKQLRVYQECLDGHADRWAKRLAGPGGSSTATSGGSSAPATSTGRARTWRADRGACSARGGAGVDALARPPCDHDEAARQPRRRSVTGVDTRGQCTASSISATRTDSDPSLGPGEMMPAPPS